MTHFELNSLESTSSRFFIDIFQEETMKSASDQGTTRKDTASKKKFSKPLMERRRRARINDSLNELKSLVLSSMNKDQSKYSKMEKADVLELTVNYLKTLNSNDQAVNEIEQQRNFIAGYNECAREVQLYLCRSAEVSSPVKARMLSHISTTPHEANEKQSQRPERSRSPLGVKPGFSQMISTYPSPPASPVATMNNAQHAKHSFQDDFYRNVPSENKASNFQAAKPLWRPWVSL